MERVTFCLYKKITASYYQLIHMKYRVHNPQYHKYTAPPKVFRRLFLGTSGGPLPLGVDLQSSVVNGMTSSFVHVAVEVLINLVVPVQLIGRHLGDDLLRHVGDSYLFIANPTNIIIVVIVIPIFVYPNSDRYYPGLENA